MNSKDDLRLHGYSSGFRTNVKYTDEDLHKALKLVAEKVGEPLSAAAYTEYRRDHNRDLPGATTIIRRYDQKWSEALRDAGLKANSRKGSRQVFNEREVLEALLVSRRILGHLPSYREYFVLWTYGEINGKTKPLKEKGLPACETIRSRYGRWRSAVQRASLYIDAKICSSCGEPTPSKKETLCQSCKV